MIFMTREQMRLYDRMAIEKYGVIGPILMENAGRGAALVVLESAREHPGPIVIVCGKGNNGGDGFVIARHLANAGLAPRVALLGRRADLGGDARLNADILAAMDWPIAEIPGGADAVAGILACSAIVVDAIFGTGLEREVEGIHRTAIEAINNSGAHVIAVDLPSGLDADTGRALGVAVRASRTATFACLKRGLVVHPGVDLAGEVTVVDIGAPARIAGEVGTDGVLLDAAEIEGILRPRAADTHKGTYGHLLLVAGSPGRTGAALMAGLAALRSGAGLVTLAVPGSILPAMDRDKPLEVMLEPLLDTIDDPVGDAQIARLDALIAGKTAAGFGPGSGVTGSMGAILRALLERASMPLVVDADGITLLAGMEPEALGSRRHPTVLTPHPGEMGRLMSRSTADVQAERIPIAREHARRTGAHIVLKGARTVIAAPDGRIAVNPTGNPGMASGGSGDVLTGIVGGLLAQGIDAWGASTLGAYVHGQAGDRAAERMGETALLATDILDAMPSVLTELER